MTLGGHRQLQCLSANRLFRSIVFSMAWPSAITPVIIHRGGRQRLIVTQPSEECLHFFAERDDAQVNRVELALDIITPFASQIKRAAKAGFIQRRHTTRNALRPRKITIFDNDNFRTADLDHPGIFFQAYDDKPSKVTGEIDCFHLEAKVNGVRALRQIGISSISDLFTFDHARFWRKNFIIVEIDTERLGRYHANRRDRTRRQSALISRSNINTDAAVGNVLFRVLALSLTSLCIQLSNSSKPMQMP
jgi:hypothetical protein